MTHGIDSSFRLRKQVVAARRRRTRLRKVFLAVGCFALLFAGVALYLTADYWSFSDENQELAVSEGVEDMPSDAAVYVPALVDLAGDPMWINLSGGGDAAPRIHSIERPPTLTQPGISSRLEVLSDTMLSSSERFMTTIPSTQQDFAFFQAQRTTPSASAENAPSASILSPSGSEEANTQIALDPEAGWGETIDSGEAALPAFEKTDIADNTSVAAVVADSQRFESTQDIFVKVLDNRRLDRVVSDAHFSVEEAKAAAEGLKTLFDREELEAGYVVAMRGYRPTREAQPLSLMQVSIYAPDNYIGTLGRNRAGAFVKAVDPWVRDDLFHYSEGTDEGAPKRQYRLLDAIYSTAARNSVPTAVIGEAIMYLSRAQDLDAFANTDERLVLVYSETGRAQGGLGGRVLYVGVLGAERNLECFVFQQQGGDFSCIGRDDAVHGLAMAGGMAAPVSGVLVSTFGPRKHPILQAVRIHKGVDWAAPAGTPVLAAFDGQIIFQGEGGGYGNLIRISHSDGSETRYAHMQGFALPGGVGTAVKAGQLIGYVGTTGLSTGPHLHFELYRGGEAVDPFGGDTVVASDDSAVDTLTDRIIHVESGGSARAKNPLSSATGLGQFIERTWIRMMHTYRADLARTLSRNELLALRYDPTISREMVRNLAREGEAYLRARGHQITAGRLYLCHFLGMEGAHLVLSRPGGTMLAEILDPSVFQANPFLSGKSAGYVLAWAERKMQGHSSWFASSPSPVMRETRLTSPEFERFKSAIAEIVNSTEGVL